MTKIRVTLKALTRLVMFWSINLHVAPEKINNNKSNRIKSTINLRDSKLYKQIKVVMKGNELELWIASLTTCNFITVQSNQ